MLRPLPVIFLILGAVAFAGCSGTPTAGPDGGDGDDEGTSNNTSAKPKAVLMRDQHARDVPTAPNPFTATFDVEAPHDQLLILLHASGVGQYRLVVKGPGEANLYDSGDQTSASEPDSHSHTGSGVRVNTTAGAHSAELSFTGGITYHLNIFSSKASDAKQPAHEH